MKIIKNLITPLISALIFSNAIADENQFNKINDKLDSITTNQETFIAKTIDSPLNDKKNGIEVNFARLLMFSDDFTSFSGTYSRFDHSKNVEWAFPVYLASQDNYENQQTNVATVDVHYRKFLGGSVRGFYISGFSRLTHINGPTGSDYDFSRRLSENGSTIERNPF